MRTSLALVRGIVDVAFGPEGVEWSAMRLADDSYQITLRVETPAGPYLHPGASAAYVLRGEDMSAEENASLQGFVGDVIEQLASQASDPEQFTTAVRDRLVQAIHLMPADEIG